MVDQLRHGPCSCARKTPETANIETKQSVPRRAGFIAAARGIQEIRKFLIIAESSCGRTWQWYTVFPFQVLNLVRIVMLEKGGKRSLTYGQLAQEAMNLPVPSGVKLKDPKEFTLIGRPTRRLAQSSD